MVASHIFSFRRFIFFHVVNAYFLHKCSAEEQLTTKDFRLQVAEGLAAETCVCREKAKVARSNKKTKTHCCGGSLEDRITTSASSTDNQKKVRKMQHETKRSSNKLEMISMQMYSTFGSRQNKGLFSAVSYCLTYTSEFSFLQGGTNFVHCFIS